MWTGLALIWSYIQTGFVGLDSVLQSLEYRAATFRSYVDFLKTVPSCCVADFIYLKCTVLFGVISYSLILYRRFGRTNYFHLQGWRLNHATSKAQARQSNLRPPYSRVNCLLVVGWLVALLFHPEDGVTTFLRNFGELLQDCTASHSRRQFGFTFTAVRTSNSTLIFEYRYIEHSVSR
jgi:hypothetical protein